MRIALVVHDFTETTGQGRYTVELARRFSRDHEVHVFANRFDQPESIGLAKGNLAYHRVMAWRATALTTILTFPLFSTTPCARGFDIVHAQGFTSFSQDVVTAHFCLSAWAKARHSEQQAQSMREKAFVHLVLPWERRMFRQQQTQWVIAVSERLKTDIAHAYGRESHVRVIRPGIDSERFHPRNRASFREDVRRRLGYSDNDFLLLYVGDLEKGCVEALRACALVPEVKLVCVSRRPAHRYARFAERLGVRDRVMFVGPTRAVEAYYAACDLFFYPTIYDAHGMVIWEAMASELPVLTTGRAGAAEVIQHLRNGIVVEDPSDVSAMADYIGQLMRNERWRKEMGQAGREAVSSYTWDRAAEQTLAVYEQIVGRKGSP
ncbi:MAG TPA: glycosyltransferase family 4 protein [Blastocatellia bacterium]|nr:glycosyltransferase family 4 protein [Blastocatellia bacterium]